MAGDYTRTVAHPPHTKTLTPQNTKTHQFHPLPSPEADAWSAFIPFCDRSAVVHEWSKADMLVHFNVAVPFLFLQR